MNSAATPWKDLFCRWPAGMPRRGVLVTSFGEQVPFAAFQTSEAFLLAERAAPDSIGARMVLLGYDSIVAVKITDVIRPKTLEPLGFSDLSVKK